MAPKYFGAFTMNFRYRDFDLAASMNYSAGNKVYNRGMEFDLMCGDYELGPVAAYVYENRWQKPGDIATHPVAKYNNQDKGNLVSSSPEDRVRQPHAAAAS